MFDLAVPWPTGATPYTPPSPAQLAVLNQTLAFLSSLGYTHVALDFTLPQGTKPPKQLNPIDLSQVEPGKLNVYTRVTAELGDMAQGPAAQLSRLQSQFDLVAVRPLTDKAVLAACTQLDVDIIALDVGKRLPCYLRHKTVGAATSRGVVVEVCYAPVLGDATSRRNWFAGVAQVVRAARGRGVVVSLGAATAVVCRAPFDVSNWMVLAGWDSSRAVEAMGTVAKKVVLGGVVRRKGHKGVVVVGKWGEVMEPSRLEKPTKPEAKRPADPADHGASKKHKH